MKSDNQTADSKLPLDDRRLDRLLDYTKFHIGIYLSIGGGLVALIGTASSSDSSSDKMSFLSEFVGCRLALVFALVFMVIAGLAGGIIASCATQSHSFEALWTQKQGPYRTKICTGESWAAIEHSAFWISIGLFSFAILSASSVREWLFGG